MRRACARRAFALESLKPVPLIEDEHTHRRRITAVPFQSSRSNGLRPSASVAVAPITSKGNTIMMSQQSRVATVATTTPAARPITSGGLRNAGTRPRAARTPTPCRPPAALSGSASTPHPKGSADAQG